MTGVQRFDAVVIGGGIFGCYAALYLAGRGRRVALLEKEQALFTKASVVNQARLHSGYHYPRSVATAAMSDEHKARFTEEHKDFVHFQFEKYYAIDRFGSFTDAAQFERFCQYLNIRCEQITRHPLFNFDRMEALYRTEEYTFDPILIREYYIKKIAQNIDIQPFTGAKIIRAAAAGNSWDIHFQAADQRIQLQTPMVINATYAAGSAVNQLFGCDELQLTHEISEIAFVTSPQFKNTGLTVMDGPFGSIMPYGRSGLLSLSSVAYTHHKISYQNTPQFDCQTADDPTCTPEAPGICTRCPRRPASNAYKMLRQMGVYFHPSVQFSHWFSYFTIKSKLKSSYIDDSRPTEISMLRKTPQFYCLFAGKINSIYEVEKIVD